MVTANDLWFTNTKLPAGMLSRRKRGHAQKLGYSVPRRIHESRQKEGESTRQVLIQAVGSESTEENHIRRSSPSSREDATINRHPMKELKFLPEPQQDRFLSDEELQHIKNSLSPEEWRAVAIALGSGLRQSEQFNLQWKHVNEEARTLTIPLSSPPRPNVVRSARM